MNRFDCCILLIFSILVSGWTPKKPADTSNPKTSNAWVKYSLKTAEKYGDTELGLCWLQEAYDHAMELQKTAGNETLLHPVDDIPEKVFTTSLCTKNLEGFKWASDRGALKKPSYQELVEYWNRGSAWVDTILKYYPDTLSFFMSMAFEKGDFSFFAWYAEEFKATGYRMATSFENMRYRQFLAEELDKAIYNQDRNRIGFLLDYFPETATANFPDITTADRLKKLGDYILYELKDETLACRLIELHIEPNRLELATLNFGDEFYACLRADPAYAMYLLNMSQANRSFTEAETAFILTLPDESLQSMHPRHINEAIETCIQTGSTNDILRLMSLHKNHAEMTRDISTELMNLALRHQDKTIFRFLKEQNTQIDIFSIDLDALAENQKLFEIFIPEIMSGNLYPLMDPYPRSDGITIGRLQRVFKHKNKAAGLFLVEHYDLAVCWEKATGGRTMLMDICRAGHLPAAKYLIEEKGADVNAQKGYRPIYDSLYGYNYLIEWNLEPIFFAAESGNYELIEYLESKGADVNARSDLGMTPLMHAIGAGHLEATKTLLQLGTNIHERTNCIDLNIKCRSRSNLTNEGLFSPIFFTAETGNCELIEYLVKNGANVNDQSNFGTTTLMHTISNGHLEATKKLIELSADVNEQMNPKAENYLSVKDFGIFDELRSPYCRAASSGYYNILDVLVKAGAQP